MKIRTARIYDARTGLANQLFVLIHRILLARRERADVLILDDFLLEMGCLDRTCPIEEILDMDHLNRVTYPLVVIGRREATALTIEDATYGTDAVRVHVPFRQSSLAPYFEWNGNLHEIIPDPAPGHQKRLNILYRIGPRLVACSYPEGVNGRLRDPIQIRLENISFSFIFGWIDSLSREAFDRILSLLQFRPGPLRSPPPFATVHVLHLRLEEDAILHWAPYNRTSPDEYRDRLTCHYLSIVQRYILPQDGCVILLSSLTESPIHECFRERRYPVFQQEKPATNGREQNALHDLLYAAQSCTGTLVANFHPRTLKGSSFSYALVRQCTAAQQIIFVDLDHIPN